MVSDAEVERRRGKFHQILAAQAADLERMAEIAEVDAARLVRAEELKPVLAELVAGGLAADFRTAVDKWSRRPGYSGFNSPNGQMFVNQMVGAASDEEVAEILRQILTLPADDSDARAKLQLGVEFVTRIRKGSFPTPTRVPFLCSFFWGWQAPEVWPTSWPSAVRSLTDLGWLETSDDLVESYMAYRDVALQLGEPTQVQDALHWFDKHRFVGLDPSLIDRCARGVEIYEQRREDAYASDDDCEEARLHARSTIAELRLLGRDLQDAVAAAVGRTVKAVVPGVDWSDGVFRADAWMTWRVGVSGAPGVMVWADAWGIGLGASPGFPRAGWWSEVPGLIEGKVPSGAKVMRIGRAGTGSASSSAQRLFPDEEGSGTDCLIGWWFPGTEMLDDPGFADRCVEAAKALQPLLDALLVGAQGTVGAPVVQQGPSGDDPLIELKERFITERDYPTAKDLEQHADRELLAAALAPDELLVGDLTELRSIINTGRYGRPGPMAELNRTIRDADPAELERLLGSLSFLCWGEEDVVARIDSVLDLDDRGARGLGESVIMKLLAITAPERFLPVFPYTGEMGKARMLKLLELAPPDAALSRGARQVDANDRLRARLDPLFPGDPWGQAQFLYWLNATGLPGPQASTGAVDELEELADRLLVPKSFLETIRSLLEDKRQVVLYGPPGTGKTYLAQELAKVLAPDPNRRMLVQFHPSTSYEDFFEGYRPEETEGQLSYRLTKGPLALLAERAEAAPGQRHVMIIDEINRANLPKVLGELLFLLEYRGEAVRTLYRPDDSFLLPPDLWFIGTMNTADRSIALIDAAMRRRFHFVPFFPNEGPMEGLLSRWLEREGEPGWIAAVVDMVNSELVDELGGPHLQVGPSHFMRKGLDEDQLGVIWEYNIYPFIEDQLFGEPQKIARFKLAEVLKRYRALSGEDEAEAPVTPASEPTQE